VTVNVANAPAVDPGNNYPPLRLTHATVKNESSELVYDISLEIINKENGKSVSFVYNPMDRPSFRKVSETLPFPPVRPGCDKSMIIKDHDPVENLPVESGWALNMNVILRWRDAAGWAWKTVNNGKPELLQ
jgi:hypothetical protein